MYSQNRKIAIEFKSCETIIIDFILFIYLKWNDTNPNVHLPELFVNHMSI